MPGADIRHTYRVDTAEARRRIREFRNDVAGGFKDFDKGSKGATDGLARASAAARSTGATVAGALSKAGGIGVESFKKQQAAIFGAMKVLQEGGQKGTATYQQLLLSANKLSAAAKASGIAANAAFQATAAAGARAKAALDQQIAAKQRLIQVERDHGKAIAENAKREADAARASIAMGRAHAAALAENARRERGSTRLNPGDFLKRGAAAGVGFLGAQVGIVGVASLVTEATQAVVGFDTAMANVKKTVGLTKAEAEPLRAELLKLSTEIPHSAETLGNIAAMAGQFGVGLKDIPGFTKTIADLSVAVDGLSSEQAASSLAKIRTITGATIPELERMASVLVRLGNEGNSTEGEILELTKRIASAGTFAGLTKAELFGFGAAMANAGVEAEAGGTAFSKTLRDISAAVAKGKEGVAGFAEIAGMSAEKFATSFKAKPAEAVTAFIAGLAKMRAEGRDVGTMLGDLDIKEARQIDMLQRLSLNTGALTDAMRSANDEYATGNALQAEAAAKAESIAGQWQLVKNVFSLVAVEIGTHVTPVFLDLFKQFQAFAKTEDFKTQVRETAIVMGQLVKVGADVLSFLVRNRELVLMLITAWGGMKLASLVTDLGALATGLSGVATAAGGATNGVGAVAGGLGKAIPILTAATIAAEGLAFAFRKMGEEQGRLVAKEVGYGKETKDYVAVLESLHQQTGRSKGDLQAEFPNIDTIRYRAAQTMAPSYQQQVHGDTSNEPYKRALAEIDRRREMAKQSAEMAAKLDAATGRQSAFDAQFKGSGGAKNIFGGSGGDEDPYGMKRAANEAKRFGYESEQALQAWARSGAAEDIARTEKRIVELGNKMHDAGKKGSDAFEEAFASIKSGVIQDAIAKNIEKMNADVAGDLSKSLKAELKQVPDDIEAIFKGIAEKNAQDKDVRKLLGLPDPVEFEKDGQALGRALAAVQNGAVPAKDAMERLTPQIVAYVEEARRAGQTVPAELDAIFNADKAQRFGVTIAGVFQGLATGATSLKSILGGIGNDLLGGLLGGKGGISKDGLLGSLGGLFGGGGSGGGGGLLGKLGGLFGGSGIASNLGSKIGGMFGPKLIESAVGPALAGGSTAMAGAVSGLATAGISAAISIGAPILLNGIKKLFSGTPEWKKVAKDAGKAYGTEVSDEMAKAIRQRQKDLGVSRSLGVALALPQMAEQATISATNLGKFTAQFDVLLKTAAAGGKGAKEALEAAGAGFAVLTQKAQEAGATGTAAFGQLIASAKAAGLESFKAFAGQQLGAGAGFLSTLLQGTRVSKGNTAELGRMGELAGALGGALNGIPGAGGIIDSLGPALDAIAEKAKKAGAALPAGIAGLIGERNFREQHKDLFAMNDALSGFTKSLGEAGFIGGPAFASIQEQARAMSTEFVGAGKSHEEALAFIAPTLQEIVNEHQRNGQAIDAETQALIDQAAGMGLVKQEGTGLINVLQQGFNAIIQQLGGDPIFGQLTAQAQNATNAAQASIQGLGAAAASEAQAIAGGVAGIAQGVAASAGASANAALGAIARLNGAAKGSGLDFDFLDRKFHEGRFEERETHEKGGPVRGRGVAGHGEWVITREGRAFAGDQALDAINKKQSAGGGGGGNVYNFNIYTAPGTTAQQLDEIARGIQQKLDNHEILVPGRAVKQGRR